MADDVAEVLNALADPTRRRVLDAVAAQGEVTATVLAAEMPVSRQAVVKHLAVLHHAGLVTSRRHGREQRYSVRPERLDAAARWMRERAVAWEDRLERIRQLAEIETRGDEHS